MTTLQIMSAIMIGLALGYVMQRPQICYNSAYRRSFFQHENTLLKTLVLAMLIQMVAFHVLVAVGVVKLNVVPPIWLAALLGGFVFGLSFVFAEGCSTTMWYRTGNGNVGSMLALVGFAVGEVLTFNGPINPLREQLAAYQIPIPNGLPGTLPNLLGISPWIFVVVLTLMGGWWLWWTSRGEQKPAQMGGWAWPVTGVLLGVLGTLAWVFSQGTGWDFGVGVVGATGPILRSFWQGTSVLTWGSFLVLGMPVGGLIAAWQRGDLYWKVPNISSSARYLVNGFIMGISASIAGGCNIGHTFTGMPTLAISSIIASITILLGALVGNWLRFTQLNNPLPAASVEHA